MKKPKKTAKPSNNISKNNNTNINSVVNTQNLNQLDTLKTFDLKKPSNFTTKIKKSISVVNPARIDDFKNDLQSRIHKVNPVSIIQEKRRNAISTSISKISNKDNIASNTLKATVCAHRKIRKAVMIAKRHSGKGTAKTKTIWSNVKC